jgi:hypothetical protein
MGNLLVDLKSLLYWDIVRRKKVTPVIVMFSFILSFAIARITVTLFPDFRVIWNQYHIHHFYYGIALIGIAGWVLLVSDKVRLHRLSAVLYGIGLGLLTDEIGLLLTCSSDAFTCNYYARQSYDIAVILVLLFLNAIYDIPFLWRPRKPIWPLIHFLPIKFP